MRGPVLAALLLLPGAVRAETIVQAIAGPPAALLDHMVRLGLTLDPNDAAASAAAVGDTAGLPARRSTTTPFVAYTAPGGEIVRNPDLQDQAVLLVSPTACLSPAVVEARLRGPEFIVPGRRTTVALYSFAAYAGRPGRTFEWFVPPGASCVQSFGIGQRRGAA